MDFSNMLQYLQGLLTNKQSTQASQFGQGLGFQQQQLGQQGSEFSQSLAAQIAQQQAAQKLAQQEQDQRNALLMEQQNQAEQGQQFNQAQTTRQTSFPYLTLMAALQQQNSPAQIAANNAFATSVNNRYDPMSPDYAFGIPNGDASKLNPYTGLTTSLAGVPMIRTAMPRMAVG